jgi:phosphatidylserine/phosphatidylglycerophosphate/cardiolipin synthase-like enzyme
MAAFRRSILILLAILALSLPASAAQHEADVTLLKNREFQTALLKYVKGARKSIIFSYFIFKTTGRADNIPRKLADELLGARKRGVDVTVILEKKSDNNDSLNRENLHTAAILAKSGVKVFFDSPKVTTHVKAAVIDDHLVLLGSHNLTQSALLHNNELSVLIDSSEIAAEIRSYLNSL